MLLLRPLNAEAPPEGLTPQTDLRGIAIHWRPAQGAHSVAGISAPPTSWSVQRVAFHALGGGTGSAPPKDAAEQARFVLAAYAITAGAHGIPSDAEIVYEVRW